MNAGVPSEAREAAIQHLALAYADDVLSLEEFERRAARVYEAATPAELSALTRDIARPGGASVASAAVRSEITRVGAFFGNVERGGPVAVPSHLVVRAVFGNLALDLRAAHFGPGVTEIIVHAVFGNVSILLPTNVVVENHGNAVLASFACRSPGMADGRNRGAARIRLAGRAVMSNVEVD